MAKIKLVEKEMLKCEAFSPGTVAIGDQTWMKANLSVDDGGKGIYHNKENDEYYYTWEAAMRIAKSIPGWHLPTDDEWVEAALTLGAREDPRYPVDYVEAGPLKEKLNVKLAGYRNFGAYYFMDSDAYFWTATEESSTTAHNRYFSTGASMDSGVTVKIRNAYSVRLVKD